LLHSKLWQVFPLKLTRLAAQVGAVMAHPKMAIAAWRQVQEAEGLPG
jgi:hypothetical protein